MRLMNIQNKLFIVFIAFGALLVVSIVGLFQWSLNRGMIEYVNQKEIDALQPLVKQLVQDYKDNGSWQSYYRKDRKFDAMIRQTLKGTEFSLPAPMLPPPEFFDGPREFDRPREHRQKNTFKKVRRQPFDDTANPRPNGRKLAPSSNDSYRPNRDDKSRRFNEHLPLGPNIRPPELNDPRSRQPKVSYALLSADKSIIVGHYPETRKYSYSPLKNDEQIVGYLAVSKRDRLTNGYEFDFVEQQQNYLWYIAVVIMLIVLLITLPFARHLLAPIKALTKGMHQLANGHYKTTLSSNRTDEFAALTRDFNELAGTLFENDTARKRWLANISHELRTPVAILKGELEAIIDGVRPLSIEHIHSAHHEVTHLQRLIADLQALTSADIGGMSYRKLLMNLNEFFEKESQKLAGYLESEKLMLRMNLPGKQINVNVFADETRLCQLFENLVNNCIKYGKTATKVEISVEVDTDLNQVNISVADDGVGVDEKHLPYLFEHLYRVDDSRNRQTGGSGLGLSICAHIVQAHQGQIFAETADLGGLAIQINLPLA